MGRQPFKARLTEIDLSSWLAGGERLKEVAERAVVGLHVHERQVSQRIRPSGGERGTQRRQDKGAGLDHGEHTQARQAAKQAAEWFGLRAGGGGQVLHRAGALPHERRQVQLGRYIQGLRDLEPA